MTRSLLLLALAACNQIFGLAPTQSRGAAFYDAPPDAPFACPAIGAGAPTLTGVLVQQVQQDCSAYSPSFASGRAAARCEATDGSMYLCEGPVDASLSFVAATTMIDTPRMLPDGNTMYVFRQDPLLTTAHILAFARSGSGWAAAPDPGFGTLQQSDGISTVMRGASGNRLIVMTTSTGAEQLDEWADDGGSWHVVGTHSPAEFGLQTVGSLTLTTDGLRGLVLGSAASGAYRTLYTDRPSVDAAFSPGQPVEGLLWSAEDAQLTDDCSRVYFSGLGWVFYVPG